MLIFSFSPNKLLESCNSDIDPWVKEVIDMCDFAFGLSRQLYRSVIPSEHDQYRQCCGIAGWNAGIALVCGNCVVWKGSPTTLLITIAMTKLVAEVLGRNSLPGAIFTAMCGGAEIGEIIAKEARTYAFL
ncbi:hypothetical protein Bca4012_063663 [Brassica carinata]